MEIHMSLTHNDIGRKKDLPPFSYLLGMNVGQKNGPEKTHESCYG
jgi:hypothetical protein